MGRRIFISLFVFLGISFSIEHPERLLDKCLLKKIPEACRKIAEAYFIVDGTAKHLGFNRLDSQDTPFMFFIALSCKYGHTIACMEAVGYQSGRINGFIRGALFVEEKDRVNLRKDPITFSWAVNEFEKAKYIQSIACDFRKVQSVSFVLKREYERACKDIFHSLQRLKDFMIQKLGFDEKYFIKFKTPKKFPLPEHMKHLSNYE